MALREQQEAGPPASAEASWNCPNCGVTVTTPFCARCGERPVRPPDLRLRSLLARLLHVTTSIDGRLLRTLRQLLRHPGSLTEAFVAGRRKPFIGPFQLFLLANVLFFAMQSVTGINVLGSSLESELHQQDWSEFAQAQVARRLGNAETDAGNRAGTGAETSTERGTGSSTEAYRPVFDRAVVVNAKSLIILMAMPFAVVCALVFLRERKPFIAHVAFSLHQYTMLLLLFSATIAGVAVAQRLGSPGVDDPQVDNLISSLLVVAFAVYLHVATSRYFGAHGITRALKVIVLTVCAGALVLAYRFVIFMITLYATT
jgi:hypothetical protein